MLKPSFMLIRESHLMNLINCSMDNKPKLRRKLKIKSRQWRISRRSLTVWIRSSAKRKDNFHLERVNLSNKRERAKRKAKLARNKLMLIMIRTIMICSNANKNWNPSSLKLLRSTLRRCHYQRHSRELCIQSSRKFWKAKFQIMILAMLIWLFIISERKTNKNHCNIWGKYQLYHMEDCCLESWQNRSKNSVHYFRKQEWQPFKLMT